jgi:hypothetical protein
MPAAQTFEQSLSVDQRLLINQLTTPHAIQLFLDDLTYSAEPIYRCPLRVLRDGVGHCFDGALFAAMALRRIGFPPLILDMVPNERDDDHLLALYQRDGHWGAIAKSNFSGLRFREPIYRNLRELVISYFEQYYNVAREKTLRGYTVPLNLTSFDPLNWTCRDQPLDAIAARLDSIRRFELLTPAMVNGLSLTDERSYRTGLQGANEAGLHRPE